MDRTAPDRSTEIAAITFDATGTLFAASRRGEIYAEVMTRHGIAIDAATAEDLVREVWREFDLASNPEHDRFASDAGGERGFWRRFVERMCEHLGSRPPSRFAVAELFDRFSRAAAWSVFPEVETVLAELGANGVRLGVVANWDSRLPALLTELGLGRFFEVVVYSAGVGVEKPHPLLFETAVDELELAAAEVLHVGDRRRMDVEGAVGAGLQALWLDRERGRGDLEDLRPLVGRFAVR